MTKLRMASLLMAVVLSTSLAGCGNAHTGISTGTIVSKSETSLRPSHAPTGAAMSQKTSDPTIPAPVSLSQLERSNAWYNVEMPDGTQGYRWGYLNGQFAMQRTVNHGDAWHALTLPVTFDLANAGNGSIESPNVQIVGNDEIWLYAIEGKTLVICKSTNAGDDWSVKKTALVQSGYRLVSVSQPSHVDAWVWLAHGSASQGKTSMFHVQSGASGIIVKPLLTGAIDSGANGAVEGAWTFSNGKQGVALSIDRSGVLHVSKTDDGAATWTSSVLRAPRPLGALPATNVYQPMVLGPEGTFVAVFRAAGSGQNGKRVVVFRSRDGGQTFAGELVDRLDQAQANYLGSPATFINPDYGYTISHGSLMRTTDSGDSWRTTHSPSLESYLHQYPCVLQMDFVSETMGYMLLGTKDHTRSILLRTDDRRYQWIPVGAYQHRT